MERSPASGPDGRQPVEPFESAGFSLATFMGENFCSKMANSGELAQAEI
jgi:hypothetical protein